MQLAAYSTYATQGGAKLQTFAEVHSEHVRGPYFRAQFLDTKEIVFYLANGNIVTEKPSQADAKYAVVRRGA